MWYSVKKKPTPLSSNVIIVGTNAEYPPFSYKENNEIVGLDIDVIKEVFKRLKKEFLLKDMPFDALIPEIQHGGIQVIAAGINPTEERAKRVIFTKPHITGNPLQIVALKSDSPITGIQDLKGKRVVVNEGYFSDSYISDQEGLLITRLSSSLVSDGILAVQSGAADAFVAAKNSLQPFFNTIDSKSFQIISLQGTEDSSALAISKNYPQLADQIQNILNTMEQDGTMLKIKKKWKVQW